MLQCKRVRCVYMNESLFVVKMLLEYTFRDTLKCTTICVLCLAQTQCCLNINFISRSKVCVVAYSAKYSGTRLYFYCLRCASTEYMSVVEIVSENFLGVSRRRKKVYHSDSVFEKVSV